MPDLEHYRRLAPFSIGELLDSANALLRPRPDLQVSERTLRYYIAERILPSPHGAPKLARYSFGHLVALLAIRGLQDRGVSLGRIREELVPVWEGREEVVAAVVQAWLDLGLGSPYRSSNLEHMVSEPLSSRRESPTVSVSSESVPLPGFEDARAWDADPHRGKHGRDLRQDSARERERIFLIERRLAALEAEVHTLAEEIARLLARLAPRPTDPDESSR